MEGVNISETESRYFGDLFLCCDVEKSGKVPILKATEMFRSANLSNDVIRQITSVAGIPQTAIHMSRVQFYSCLKLIAAYQASIPLRQELIETTIALPLPKFSWTTSPTHSHLLDTRGSSDFRNGCIQSLINLATATNHESNTGEITNSDIPSTDSEVEHTSDADASGSKDRTIRRRGAEGGGSPEAWSTASDSPTPTNSVTERPWAKNTLWQGLFCEEQRQLLGTEEESSDRHSSDDDNEVDLETIYQITPEQREYYLTQFRAVQPDLSGLLSGQVARIFFEKSRIPIEELRHIWQLCDVTRDGALSLDEFTAAMHLVVLRRNNIPLPPILPSCLMPSSMVAHGNGGVGGGGGGGSSGSTTTSMTISAGPAEADLLHLDDDEEIDIPQQQQQQSQPSAVGNNDDTDYKRMISVHQNSDGNTSTSNRNSLTGKITQTFNLNSTTNNNHNSRQHNISPTISTTSQSQSNSPLVGGGGGGGGGQQPSVLTTSALPSSSAEPITPPRLSKEANDWINQSKEWTKFTESPTSNVSSPGPKPVNFDMQRTAQAVVSDPLILHPVPVRVTPIGIEILDDDQLLNGGGSCTTRIRNKSDGNVNNNNIINLNNSNSNNNNNHNNNSNSNSNSNHNNNNSVNAFDATIATAAAASIQMRDKESASPNKQQTTNISFISGGGGSVASGSLSQQRDSLQNEFRAIQRPQPKKVPSKSAIGAIPPPPQREPSIGGGSTSSGGGGIGSSTSTDVLDSPLGTTILPPPPPPSSLSNKKEVPPLPPPRPHKHVRSSSLDLNKFKLNAPTPPEVPPRVSPQIISQVSLDVGESCSFADFAHFPDSNQIPKLGNNHIPLSASNLSTPLTTATTTTDTSSSSSSSVRHTIPSLRTSAFEVYRKPIQTPKGFHSPESTPGGHIGASGGGGGGGAGNSGGVSNSGIISNSRGSSGNGNIPVAITNLVAAATSNVRSFALTDMEQRISWLNENLRHVTFKEPERGLNDFMNHLKEQNSLLLRMCNDLTEELASVQRKKEEVKAKLDA